MSQIRTREEIVKEIDAQTQASGRIMHRGKRWMNRWSPSTYFVLREVRVDKIEQPLKPHSMKIVASKMKVRDNRPIFIDANYPNKTTWRADKTNGRKLKTLVIDGKHRIMAASLLGIETIQAWIGIQALPHFLDDDSKGYNWLDHNKSAQKFRSKR